MRAEPHAPVTTRTTNSFHHTAGKEIEMVENAGNCDSPMLRLKVGTSVAKCSSHRVLFHSRNRRTTCPRHLQNHDPSRPLPPKRAARLNCSGGKWTIWY